MTDKQNFEKDINVPSKEQIIIDGIDVNKCERHCKDNYSTPNMCYCETTRGYRNCSPKQNQCDFYITSIEEQLHRKTQEYNELLEQHKELDDRANRLIEEKYNLSRECEELKKRNKLLLIKGQEGISKRDWAYEQCKKRADRYRKALEEIEEIVKQTCRKRCTNDCLGTKKALWLWGNIQNR